MKLNTAAVLLSHDKHTNKLISRLYFSCSYVSVHLILFRSRIVFLYGDLLGQQYLTQIIALVMCARPLNIICLKFLSF